MILFSEDFYSGFFNVGTIGSKADWFIYENGDFRAKDPAARLSVLKKRLSVNIPEYSLTTTGLDDHLKYLFFLNAVNEETGMPGFRVPDAGLLKYEICARFMPRGTDENPFDAEPDDYRLSSGAVVATDFASRTSVGFLLTDRQAFVLYSRSPVDIDEMNPSAFFTYVIPAVEIDPGSEHLYKIAYDPVSHAVAWVIDHVPVFRLDAFGRRLGPEHDADCVYHDMPGCESAAELPRIGAPQLAFGAGLMTFLDAGIRHDKELADVSRTSVQKGTKVFGQGGELVIGRVKVTARPPDA
jgi:hypothetical protein